MTKPFTLANGRKSYAILRYPELMEKENKLKEAQKLKNAKGVPNSSRE